MSSRAKGVQSLQRQDGIHALVCTEKLPGRLGAYYYPLARSGAQEPKGWPGSTWFPENSYSSHGPRGALRASFLDKTSFIDNRGGHGEFRENIFFSLTGGISLIVECFFP